MLVPDTVNRTENFHNSVGLALVKISCQCRNLFQDMCELV